MPVTGPILTEKARLLFPSTDSFHLHVSEQIHLLLKYMYMYMYTCTITNKGVWITLCITTLSNNFKSISSTVVNLNVVILSDIELGINKFSHPLAVLEFQLSYDNQI